MDYMGKRDNEQISAYYSHARHLHDLIVKEMPRKPQKKNRSYLRAKYLMYVHHKTCHLIDHNSYSQTFSISLFLLTQIFANPNNY